MVKLLSSRAKISPRIVTARAENLAYQGIVRIWVPRGGKLEKIMNPAKILPNARRLIGLIRLGLFSFMEMSGVYRGLVMETKKIIRML